MPRLLTNCPVQSTLTIAIVFAFVLFCSHGSAVGQSEFLSPGESGPAVSAGWLTGDAGDAFSITGGFSVKGWANFGASYAHVAYGGHDNSAKGIGIHGALHLSRHSLPEMPVLFVHAGYQRLKHTHFQAEADAVILGPGLYHRIRLTRAASLIPTAQYHAVVSGDGDDVTRIGLSLAVRPHKTAVAVEIVADKSDDDVFAGVSLGIIRAHGTER